MTIAIALSASFTAIIVTTWALLLGFGAIEAGGFALLSANFVAACLAILVERHADRSGDEDRPL